MRTEKIRKTNEYKLKNDNPRSGKLSRFTASGQRQAGSHRKIGIQSMKVGLSVIRDIGNIMSHYGGSAVFSGADGYCDAVID